MRAAQRSIGWNAFWRPRSFSPDWIVTPDTRIAIYSARLKGIRVYR